MSQKELKMLKREKQVHSEKEKAFLDALKIVLSNLIHLLSGICVGLLIPKILGYNDYGFYKTFTLYISYLGLLHFGISDGVYFVFAGKNENEIDKKKVHSALSFLFFLELSFTIIGSIVSLSFIGFNYNYAIIFLLVSIYNIVTQMENVCSLLCQALKLFSFSSIVNIAKAIINILYVGTFYILSKTSFGSNSNFITFSLLSILVSLFADFLYTLRLKKIIFSKGQQLNETIIDVKEYIRVGFPLLLANLTSNLLMSIDQQVISIFYPVSESNIYSIYSFAYTMLNVITLFTSAVSQVLFPYMRGKNKDNLIKNYSQLSSIMDIFMGLACLSYFFLYWFINNYLSKYSASMPIFQIILPGLAINIPVAVIMHSYYKTFNKEKTYFIQNICILALAVLSDLLVYYLYIKPYSYNNPILISVTSFFVILVWYIVSESYLINHYKIKHWKNDVYLLTIILAFFFSSFTFTNVTGTLVYCAFLLGISLCFYSKEIDAVIDVVKTKRQNKKQGKR
jgi:O-antigen/teichoic acid export membrane protein